MKDYVDNRYIDNQQAFEESFDNVNDIVHETCDKCGKITVCENTVDLCEEPTCSYDQLEEQYHNPGYSELMFDEDGNYVKNFLGHEK